MCPVEIELVLLSAIIFGVLSLIVLSLIILGLIVLLFLLLIFIHFIQRFIQIVSIGKVHALLQNHGKIDQDH